MSLPTISVEQYRKIVQLDKKEEITLPQYEYDKLSYFLKAYLREKNIDIALDIQQNIKSTIQAK